MVSFGGPAGSAKSGTVRPSWTSESPMPDVAKLETVRELISAEEITRRRRELAGEIERDYGGEDLLLVCILRGSMVFFVDLAREIDLPLRFDYVDVSSYGDGTSPGALELRADLREPIEGRHVLLVEDIVDTGRTARFLVDRLSARGPASLHVAALLDKPSRRVVDVEIAYCGFTIPDRFVVGYGLDWAQLYRNLPYIGVLDALDGAGAARIE